jgi:hypothetical protein
LIIALVSRAVNHAVAAQFKEYFVHIEENGMKKSILIITLLLLIITPVTAQTADGEEYVVQAGDWLSKIAEEYYGDPLAYPVIVEATNAKAAEDESFSLIEEANLAHLSLCRPPPSRPG